MCIVTLILAFYFLSSTTEGDFTRRLTRMLWEVGCVEVVRTLAGKEGQIFIEVGGKSGRCRTYTLSLRSFPFHL